MKLPMCLRNSIGRRNKSRKQSRPRLKSRWLRLCLEILEDRLAPANAFWNVDGNGFWEVAGNWSTGAVPGAADDVFLDRPAGNFTITHGAADFAVNSIHASKDALVVAGGALTIAATSELGDFSCTSLVLNGSLTTSGTVNNHGTIVQHDSGSLTIGGEFTNSQGALYDIQNDSGIGVLNQGSFVNLGTLRKSGGAGTSTISAPVNNSGGTLEAQTGVLSLTGGGTFTGGVFGAAAGAFLDLSSIAYSGTFTGFGSGLVRLRNGLTLGPSGATFNFNGQWLNGTWILGDTGLTNTGTLATAGPDNKAFSGLFTNSGTFIHRATGDLQVGYLDFFSDHPGTLNNTTSGVIDFQADSNLSNGTNAPLDYVNNAGIIRKSAGTGSSTIFPAINFTSTAGIFDIRSGTFSLLGGGVFTGGGIFNASAGATLVFVGDPFLSRAKF